MASKAAAKNMPPKKTTRARAEKKNAPQAQANNSSKRQHVATRAPVEILAAECARQATRAKGEQQQEWFALGSWVSQFRVGQQSESTAATIETPRALAAGAGG